ncbi:hypothetical protein WJX73_005643 [Symbiochloris irregularis]|uniref:Uncharacterized protein n=1 Tax=Symbiochloris irregularis TaxID=706552 RepID=A0AAW1NVS0_9CHLO
MLPHGKHGKQHRRSRGLTTLYKTLRVLHAVDKGFCRSQCKVHSIGGLVTARWLQRDRCGRQGQLVTAGRSLRQMAHLQQQRRKKLASRRHLQVRRQHGLTVHPAGSAVPVGRILTSAAAAAAAAQQQVGTGKLAGSKELATVLPQVSQWLGASPTGKPQSMQQALAQQEANRKRRKRSLAALQDVSDLVDPDADMQNDLAGEPQAAPEVANKELVSRLGLEEGTRAQAKVETAKRKEERARILHLEKLLGTILRGKRKLWTGVLPAAHLIAYCTLHQIPAPQFSIHSISLKQNHGICILPHLGIQLSTVREFPTFDKAKEAVALFTLLFMEEALDSIDEHVHVLKPGDAVPVLPPKSISEVEEAEDGSPEASSIRAQSKVSESSPRPASASLTSTKSEATAGLAAFPDERPSKSAKVEALKQLAMELADLLADEFSVAA